MMHNLIAYFRKGSDFLKSYWAKWPRKQVILSRSTNINHKGLQRTANEYAEKRRIYKDLISKNEK